MCAFATGDMKGAPPQKDPAEKGTSEKASLNPTLAEIAGNSAPGKAYSPIVLAGSVRLVEFVMLLAAGVLVHELHVAPNWGRSLDYYLVMPAMALAAIAVMQSLELYTPASFRAPTRDGMKAAAAWSLVFIVALIVLFFFRLDDSFSRVWLLGWYATGLALLAGERLALSVIVRALTRQGKLERRTVIVGGGELADPVLRALAAQDNGDLRILGLFDDRADERSPDVVAGYPKLGNIVDLVEFARHTRVDLIIFTLPITAEDRILEMLRKLWVLPIDIRLAAHTNKLRFRPRSYSYIGSVPVIDIFDKPIADWDVVVKNIFDRVVGALCLILASPIMALIAIAVKLDSPGPVLFKQLRHGFNNENIEVYKFRSMYVDKLDHSAAKQVTRNDPRVTRVGRFIRKTSLDELPQLFNVVFKGNLSLVGPRPHAIIARAAEHVYEEVVDGYFARHRVKPGITGWAQINGWRGETDTPEKIQKRVECDLYYIENWSILLDVYILAMTPFALIKAENAY
ncbi:undecaprenyl-phosphate glucose phosphotransferase [Methylocystis sp. MJC1]|jgi:Undecaprenyl-phosphate glucose phosphotransferase|uniref:undecaprenyl-phosphate glucose phosphotransferase n=1 Tax=Methylocystis sp. MJC1 TaxID=2654282 RepID=UPI0019D0B2B3|nr:undecaprenyl-phosphate glucose phosphotransferase [Methylocystis sp. MJC1]KAF2990061.1 UDP-glucose:undecaprenyl-phosphate glucose-1-phosphate transferase [Methylocystis sp. MJC1]MBU6527682.1 undecaprenyl-phosphate glucose phosphotransferase [Methylocystis sp. MJC1]UZX10618.1 undecaprenyl-phosphate glucose phosphotransferase [Methylocystis sp. MJC1]